MNTIEEAKRFILAGREEAKGCYCPVCEQKVKVYPRPLGTVQAIAAIVLSAHTEEDPSAFVHVQTVFATLRVSSKLKIALASGWMKIGHWDMARMKPLDPEEGASGMWQITDVARDFANGILALPKKAYVTNSRVLGFSEELITVEAALGYPFSYADVVTAPSGYAWIYNPKK